MSVREKGDFGIFAKHRTFLVFVKQRTIHNQTFGLGLLFANSAFFVDLVLSENRSFQAIFCAKHSTFSDAENPYSFRKGVPL